MDFSPSDLGSPSRLRLLLDHFSRIEDAREPHRVAFPMAELLLLAVCGTIADCDDYDAIAVWGDTHLDFLRRFLPYHHGVPSGRWLTIMMNRIDPALFSACFTSWVRACWPDRPELVAIDGKTSRRSHDRGQDRAPLHLVSAFATTSRLVLGQEAVAGKSNELTAIPALLERLAAGGGLRGAIVTIDAIACNGAVAKARRAAVPRRTAPARRRRDRQGRKQGRTEGSLPFRDPLLCRLDAVVGPSRRRSRPRPLGDRKPTALGARRRLQRRPVPAAQGSRRSQHGGRAPFRHQSGPNRARSKTPSAADRPTASHQSQRRPAQNQHQASSKNRRMGPQISTRRPRRQCPLTWIRSPVMGSGPAGVGPSTPSNFKLRHYRKRAHLLP